MAEITLITGGARSGKSSFALELAESIGTRRLFIATCPRIDQEMAERVRRHQEERLGRGWTTLEEERNLDKPLKDVGESYDVILIDCITLWINNILFEGQNDTMTIDDSEIRRLCDFWLAAAMQNSSRVIVVTNEVGLGIVPENKVSRLYRDLVGTANQAIGAVASEVILVSCGIPLYLKKSES